MPIPDFQSFMLPALKSLVDGEVHHWHDALKFTIDYFKITEAESKELLASGYQRVVDNRVSWSGSYLKKAEFISSPKRGYWQITQAGKDFLATNPGKITVKLLKDMNTPVADWWSGNKNDEATTPEVADSTTPQETMEQAFQTIRKALKDELLQMVMNNSPDFFEQIVIDLLVKMGYGGNYGDAQRLGRSGDGGVDGVIMEDRLGLDHFYVQAKRWNPDQTIGRPEIQKFAGALAGQKARRGIFISTAKYSQDAWNYVEQIDTRIVLIDGNRLTDLMIDVGLGVSLQQTYEIKKIDTDYFAGE